MQGVDAYSLLSSLPLLTSQEVQGFYRGWAGEGAPPPDNSPHLEPHRAQANWLGSRQRTGLTMVGPLQMSRLTKSNTSTG